jgi:hypothetical protein
MNNNSSSDKITVLYKFLHVIFKLHFVLIHKNDDIILIIFLDKDSTDIFLFALDKYNFQYIKFSIIY